jgi:hypothetical protein
MRYCYARAPYTVKAHSNLCLRLPGSWSTQHVVRGKSCEWHRAAKRVMEGLFPRTCRRPMISVAPRGRPSSGRGSFN